MLKPPGVLIYMRCRYIYVILCHVRRESFYGRFSTSSVSVDRKSPRGQFSAPVTTKRESFYGRFSTSIQKRVSIFGKDGSLWELLVMLVVAFDLVFGLVRPFVAEPMRVPSESMAPTLQTEDHVLTNKLAYDFADPERGDLAVFKSVARKEQEDVVKRVVGLPGDEILVRNGVLLVNGEPQYEPYLAKEEYPTTHGLPGIDSFGPMVVPQDHIFVMGDNRTNSYDSRFFGPVPKENLIGEVSLRFWPANRLGTP